jgi:hypothetical protein
MTVLRGATAPRAQRSDVDRSAGCEDCTVCECDDGVAADKRNNHIEGLAHRREQSHRKPIDGTSGEPDRQNGDVRRLDRARVVLDGGGPSGQPLQADLAAQGIPHGAVDARGSGHKHQLALFNLDVGDRVAPG